MAFERVYEYIRQAYIASPWGSWEESWYFDALAELGFIRGDMAVERKMAASGIVADESEPDNGPDAFAQPCGCIEFSDGTRTPCETHVRICDYCDTPYHEDDDHQCPITCAWCGKKNVTIEHVGTHIGTRSELSKAEALEAYDLGDPKRRALEEWL